MVIQAHQLFGMELVAIMGQLQGNRAEQWEIMSDHRDDRRRMEKFLEGIETFEESHEKWELTPMLDSTNSLNPVWVSQTAEISAQKRRLWTMLQDMADHECPGYSEEVSIRDL